MSTDTLWPTRRIDCMNIVNAGDCARAAPAPQTTSRARTTRRAKLRIVTLALLQPRHERTVGRPRARLRSDGAALRMQTIEHRFHWFAQSLAIGRHCVER